MKINSIGGFEHIKNGTRKNQALQFRLEIRFERQMNRMENGDKKKQTNKPPSRPDVRQSSRISVTSESDGIRKNPSNDSGAILP